MNSIIELNKASRQFFSLHWPRSDIFGAPPTWVRWDPFLRGCVPNHTLGGCYALFAGHGLIYVGKGVSQGRGSTPYHGISRRLSSHVLRIDRYENDCAFFKLTDRFSDTTEIYTIGFSSEIEYLALALEDYLIRELSPPKNLR